MERDVFCGVLSERIWGFSLFNSIKSKIHETDYFKDTKLLSNPVDIILVEKLNQPDTSGYEYKRNKF